MGLLQGKRFWSFLAIGIIVAVAGGLVASFGPPKLYAKSETPEFCAACHVMEAQYDAWRHQGAHRRIKCIDCHLPNDQIVNHLFQKSYQGMWDTFIFYSGRVPETIRLSENGVKIVKANCERCHAETIARVSMNDRKCWDCHRRLTHTRSGLIETLTLN
jgi:cytochrome c nitrite reductase small subunit